MSPHNRAVLAMMMLSSSFDRLGQTGRRLANHFDGMNQDPVWFCASCDHGHVHRVRKCRCGSTHLRRKKKEE